MAIQVLYCSQGKIHSQKKRYIICYIYNINDIYKYTFHILCNLTWYYVIMLHSIIYNIVTQH